MTEKQEREVVWAGVRTPSLEHCTITKERENWKFNGLVVFVKPTPFAVYYAIKVDKGFTTRNVSIKKLESNVWSKLEIRTAGQKWYLNGKERDDLRGCTDIDLEVSPVTNTLPIRRAKPKVGDRVDLTAAWVRFPSMKVQPIRQSYTRLRMQDYLYRSSSGFKATVSVDDFGLVTRYGNIWKRVE